MEIKSKTTLNARGEEAYVAVKQLMVTLRWTAGVDLDLMAFYRTKDGRVGGVFSEEYPGGSRGNLNGFPFIQLSGDAGLGATRGSNEEVIRITRLDDHADVFILAINYTAAVEQRDVDFGSYDGTVTVLDDRGEAVEIPLRATEPGAVAHVCRIDNRSMLGAKLVNMNEVLDLAGFVSRIPGAAALVK